MLTKAGFSFKQGDVVLKGAYGPHLVEATFVAGDLLSPGKTSRQKASPSRCALHILRERSIGCRPHDGTEIVRPEGLYPGGLEVLFEKGQQLPLFGL